MVAESVKASYFLGYRRNYDISIVFLLKFIEF